MRKIITILSLLTFSLSSMALSVSTSFVVVKSEVLSKEADERPKHIVFKTTNGKGELNCEKKPGEAFTFQVDTTGKQSFFILVEDKKECDLVASFLSRATKKRPVTLTFGLDQQMIPSFRVENIDLRI